MYYIIKANLIKKSKIIRFINWLVLRKKLIIKLHSNRKTPNNSKYSGKIA